MASISFTDAVGSATLDNGLTGVAGGVASRFAGWVPLPRVVGPVAHALATGAMQRFRFRTDYGARFTMRDIPNSSLATAHRLIVHLLDGGTCTVTTGDSASRVYATCGLAPDTEPELVPQDAAQLTYALSLSLINLAGSPTAMLCVY